MPTSRPAHAEIVVDLAAVRANVATLAAAVAPSAVMVVVKADGYGHGMLPVARAARRAGAPWLGVATLDEALELRRGGDTGRVLCWLAVPGEDYDSALRSDVDVTAYSTAELDEVAAAAERTGVRARVQLKVDTGLSRGGSPMATWPDLVEEARRLERAGLVAVTGVWSHLAAADDPEHPANDAQHAVFEEALQVAADAGLRPEVRHLANSAAGLLRPSARYDLVRFGIAAYGLDPAPGRTPEVGLVPAMTVRARLALSKELRPGDGVSYGHTWVADRKTSVGLVPVGYADGIPRSAGNRASVWVDGRQRPVRGRVCMDQFLVDLDGERPAPGTEVVVLGPGRQGEPTAQDWAEACDTISYEIVTRIGGRMARVHVGEGEA